MGKLGGRSGPPHFILRAVEAPPPKLTRNMAALNFNVHLVRSKAMY